jgi:hypothetical protein
MHLFVRVTHELPLLLLVMLQLHLAWLLMLLG